MENNDKKVKVEFTVEEDKFEEFEKFCDNFGTTKNKFFQYMIRTIDFKSYNEKFESGDYNSSINDIRENDIGLIVDTLSSLELMEYIDKNSLKHTKFEELAKKFNISTSELLIILLTYVNSNEMSIKKILFSNEKLVKSNNNNYELTNTDKSNINSSFANLFLRFRNNGFIDFSKKLYDKISNKIK